MTDGEAAGESTGGRPARVRSGALRGIEGLPVDVEVDIGSGLPAQIAPFNVRLMLGGILASKPKSLSQDPIQEMSPTEVAKLKASMSKEELVTMSNQIKMAREMGVIK